MGIYRSKAAVQKFPDRVGYGRPDGMTSYERQETAMRRPGRASGPVHRSGPLWYDPALDIAEDPARMLLAPAPGFHIRLRRMVRSVMLLAASASMTPALPALLG
jgi:hypothetical protein